MSFGRRWRDYVFWGAHSITWDSGASDEVRTRRALDVVAWLSALGVPDGGAVLDLGCATGELSVALSTAGFDVVGVDLSRAMLRRAGRKGQGLKRAPVFQLAARASSPPSAAIGARLFAPAKRWASRWARHLPAAALVDLVETAGFLDVSARSVEDRVELSGRAL